MNVWDILLLALIGSAIFYVFRYLRRQRKNGGSTCGGNCAACSQCKECNKKPPSD